MFLDFMYIIFVIIAIFIGFIFITIWHQIAKVSTRLSLISLLFASLYFIVSLFQCFFENEEEYFVDLFISLFAVVTFLRSYSISRKKKKNTTVEFQQFIDL